jgi:hypothetical protein
LIRDGDRGSGDNGPRRVAYDTGNAPFLPGLGRRDRTEQDNRNSNE